MELKELRATETQLPEIGLGTWAYTGGERPLRRGIDLGAYHIDTAESYGTEEAVGQAVRSIRYEVFIATKVSPENFRHDDLIQAAENSLRLLKTDYIDLYQLHSPNTDIPIEETMAAMEDLVGAGKVRFIGVSNFSVDQLKEAQGVMSKHPIVSNQVEYSLVERGIEEDVLSYCQQNRVTVIAYSPLGTGLRNLQARDKAEALSKVAATTGRTEAQVALNWCIAKEGVVAIPKANSVQHVEENCAASGWRLSMEDRDLLEEAFQ